MQLPTEFTLLEFSSLDSTNNYAKKLALDGAKEKTVIIAKKQTAGRGQVGRTFFSPEGTGLYMSVILRPEFDFSFFPFITSAAAVAVSNAIDKFTDTKTKIKWVNDIFLNGKKICGILTESVVCQEEKPFAVLGIGVNLTRPENDYPDEIKDIAGCIFENKDNITSLGEDLAKEILTQFFKIYHLIPEKQFLYNYRQKSILIGKSVSFEHKGLKLCGKALDIDQNANLVVETADGIITLSSGKASVRLNEE